MNDISAFIDHNLQGDAKDLKSHVNTIDFKIEQQADIVKNTFLVCI